MPDTTPRENFALGSLAIALVIIGFFPSVITNPLHYPSAGAAPRTDRVTAPLAASAPEAPAMFPAPEPHAGDARVIAEHYGRGIEVQSWPFEAAHKAMGVMAEIAAVNCVISADRARRELGWSPVGPSLMGELVIGSYRALAPNS